MAQNKKSSGILSQDAIQFIPLSIPLKRKLQPAPGLPGFGFEFYEYRLIPLQKNRKDPERILGPLEDLVRSVQGNKQQQRFNRIGMQFSDGSNFDRLEYCSQAFAFGALPDAETLEYIATSIAKYVQSDGTISLDEAFGLKSKAKAGNPARQAFRKNKVNQSLLRMMMYRHHNPKCTLERAAESALQLENPDGRKDSVDTLVREYVRRKFDKTYLKKIREQ